MPTAKSKPQTKETEESREELRARARANRPEKKQDLAQFAREGENIYVQNTLPTISILVVRLDGVDNISEFGPKNDPQGNDIAELPAVYLKNAQFRKQLRLGIYKVVDSDDPEVVDAVEREQNSWDAQQSAKQESDRFIDAQQPKAFSGQQCIAQEGRNQCSEYAIFGQNQAERPPLCSKHAHLSSQFTPEETGTFTNGKPDIHWSRVQLLGR